MFEFFEKEWSIFEYIRHYSYTEVPKWTEKDPLKEREYAAIYIRSENFSRNYTRRTYGLIEYLGDLGGIQEIIFAVCGYLVGFLIQRMFNAELVQDIYKV